MVDGGMPTFRKKQQAPDHPFKYAKSYSTKNNTGNKHQPK